MRPIMIDFPLPIVTPRLLLRQPIMGYVDAHEYTKAVTESMDELRPWMPWAQYHPTVNQSEEYIRECCANWILKNNNNIGLPLWIIEKTSGIFIGHIVMWNIAWDIPKFELGFWMRTSHTHKGYTTEATNALIRYCFLQLGVRRIEIRCEAKNVRSQLIPQHLGFQLDGTLRNNSIAVADGRHTDVLVFSCIDLKNLPELEVKWGDAAKAV
ncbi:Ribosomal protein N-acetyltransferase [Gammaproteobacteria bacterium]